MTTDPSIREQGYQYFLQEAPELLQALEQDLLSLREDYSINKVNNLMRATHTLKGAAASIGLETIKTVAHYLEDIFKALCRPDLSLEPTVEALLFEGFECLRLPLNAELTGGQVDDAEVLNRTAAIFAQLQEQLGDCFEQEAHLPSSAELGFDVTQSMFEVGVAERLERIADAVTTADPEEMVGTLQTQADVFLGLAESLDLPGFGAIAQTILNALEYHPNQAAIIAQVALKDLRAGQEAVLGGDRSQGGCPSEQLRQLAEPTFNASELAIEYATEEADTATGVAEIGAVEIREVEIREVEIGEVGIGAVEIGEVEIGAAEIAAKPALTLETADNKNSEPFWRGLHKALQWVQDSVSTPVGSQNNNQSNSTPVSSPNQAADSSLISSELHRESNGESQHESDDEKSVNLLVENIWGEQATLAGLNSESSIESSIESSTESGDQGLVTMTAALSTPTHAPEELNLTNKVSPSPSQPPTITPSPIPQREKVSLSPTVRVNVEHLDRLNYSVGEMLTNQNRQLLQTEQLQTAVRTLFARLQQQQQLLNEFHVTSDRKSRNLTAAELQSQRYGAQVSAHVRAVEPESSPHSREPIAPSKSETSTQVDALELDDHSESQVLIEALLDETIQLTEAAEAIDLFTRQSSQTLEKQRRFLTSTRDALIEARMLPLGDIFNRFPRILKQLETLHNKQVALELSGIDVLVDKVIAEKLYDPLLHLVRNAFDHGIESAVVRQQNQKANQGRIGIEAYHQGKHLVIEVRDDGNGLDFEQIRQRAVERQLVSPEQAGQLNQRQLTDLLFEPGFSTTSQVNNLSGRGVGLDVVRTQLQALQGVIEVNAERYKGTTFALKIPLSLTISKLFLCQAGGHTYAFLTDKIEQILQPQPTQLRSWEGGKSLRWGKDSDERLIQIVPLAKAINYFSRLPEPGEGQSPG
ncbi:MAG: hybrid sensor histidine kinase/response regulator, partial [Cyanothece sp. SIO1E1]|nr:hybrid sensor histidine kinase/response regulator [Cyanothece sp. SIO1E1]